MHTRVTNMGVKLAIAALAGASLSALGACSEHPYPAAAPQQATEAPPPGDASLMGAPQGPGYTPTTRTPEYIPPGTEGPPPGYAGQPGYPPPPPPSGMGPGYPPGGYPPAYRPGGPPEIVSMAPIPNPPESGDYYGRWYGPHHPHHVWLYGQQAAAPYHHRYHERFYAHARRRLAPPAHPGHSVEVHPHAAPARKPPHVALPGHAAATAGAAAGAAQLAKPHALSGRHHHLDRNTVAEASGGSTNTTGTNTMASGTEAERFQALQSALHTAFNSAAVLTVPANMEANQAANVTLQLPADFAETARKEAARQGLSDAAASMNLIATLSGDGYTIVPAEAQSLPLTADQPTTFQWKVTPTGATRGALKASVRAQAVGAGQYMTLGDKTQGAGGVAGRVIGIGVLALIALLLLGWAARRRPRPKPTGAVKPSAAYDRPPY